MRYTIVIDGLLDWDCNSYSIETSGNTFDECVENAIYIFHSIDGENTWRETEADGDEVPMLILEEITKNSSLRRLIKL